MLYSCKKKGLKCTPACGNSHDENMVEPIEDDIKDDGNISERLCEI